jgi:predicted Rossmann-fold nucleotide-binding protein
MVPVILIGRDYWEPLVQWMERTLLQKYHTIAPDDLKIWTLTDDLEEATRLVEASMDRQREQRINLKGRATKTPDDKLNQATRPMKKTEQ